MVDHRVGRNAMGEPYVSTNNASFADHRIASQYVCPGLDNYFIFKRGLPFGGGLGLVNIQCSQCNPLVDLNIVTDNGGLTDHHTGAVVNGKSGTYLCTRVNIDAGFTMGMLAKQSW